MRVQVIIEKRYVIIKEIVVVLSFKVANKLFVLLMEWVTVKKLL